MGVSSDGDTCNDMCETLARPWDVAAGLWKLS